MNIDFLSNIPELIVILVSSWLGSYLIGIMNGYKFPDCLGGKEIKPWFDFEIPDIIG